MPARVLIVEERLRVVVVYLDALKHLALLVDSPVLVPQFESPRQFAQWVATMADATATQVHAIRSALPSDVTNSEAPSKGRHAMTPADLARAFVETAIGDVLRDFLNLSERHPAAYRAVERVVRKQQDISRPNLDRLEQAIRDAAPETHRAALSDALNRLTTAHSDELTVKQQTAYLIGVAVGRALSRSLAGKVGA